MFADTLEDLGASIQEDKAMSKKFITEGKVWVVQLMW
jgi:hypothetical protein